MNYCFDIDGTITVETKGFGYTQYLNRTPKTEMIKIINKLMDEGNTIILYTSRFEEDEKVTKEWLKKHGVKYHMLKFNKIHYDYWIDDKAINELVFRELKIKELTIGENDEII